MAAQTPSSEGRWRRWWPLVALCVLAGSRWILSDALPGTATSFASASFGCGSAAVMVMLVRRRVFTAADRRTLLRAAAGGALVLSGPLMGLLRAGVVDASSMTIALALTPVVIAIAEAAGPRGGVNLPGRLWPGLAAVAGLLLLLAEPSLTNPVADALMLAAPVMTGCGAAMVGSCGEGRWRLPAALLGACALLGIMAAEHAFEHAGTGVVLLGVASGLDAALAVLSLIALGRVSATRWSAQFALVPLLVLLEALVLMRDSVPLRTLAGMGLLAAASAALLAPPADEEIRLDLGPTRAPR